MTTLYLVRHVQSLGNSEARFQGHIDKGEISEAGTKQLERLAWRFREVPLQNIYTSPLQRAVTTAKAINRNTDLPLILDEELMEINGGAFEGMLFEELPKIFPHEFFCWSRKPHQFEAPGGETMLQVFERMRKVMHRILHANMGGTIAVVSHGCAIRNYQCHLTETPFERLDKLELGVNASVNRIDFEEDWTYDICYLNDISHLPQEASASQGRAVAELPVEEEEINL